MSVKSVAEVLSVDLLTRRYHGVLVRYFRRRGFNPNDTMDLVQEVFERLSGPDVLDRVDHGGVPLPHHQLNSAAEIR